MNNPIIRFFYVLYYVPLLIFLTVIAGTIAIVISFFSIKAGRYISNIIWGHIALGPAGIKLNVQGRENLPPENSGGYIIYANHSSMADIPTVALSTGLSVSWVAKAALGKIPFFGWTLKRVHMLVDRGGGTDSARKMVEEATTRLKGGEILAIFPEGTRNRSAEPLLPFKKGAFILAKHTGAPIVPVAIKNARQLWPAGTLWPHPGTIRVKIGHAVYPQEGEALKVLTQKAQDALEALLTDESW